MITEAQETGQDSYAAFICGHFQRIYLEEIYAPLTAYGTKK